MSESFGIPDQRSVDHFFSRLTKELAETFSLTLRDASYVARPSRDDDPNWWAWEYVHRVVYDDPEAGWSLLLRLIHEGRDEDVLGYAFLSHCPRGSPDGLRELLGDHPEFR